MAHSEVLLLQPVDGLGAEGDQVKVRAGYARNFLLPQGMAVPLTGANRKRVEALKKARANGKVDEIEVLAWADREYPASSERTGATRREVTLAEDRAEVIEDYLEDEIDVSADVDTHNMAKRPGRVSRLFQTDDYKIKATFEGAGASSETSYSKSAGSFALIQSWS